jgi:hypothetical protein
MNPVEAAVVVAVTESADRQQEPMARQVEPDRAGAAVAHPANSTGVRQPESAEPPDSWVEGLKEPGARRPPPQNARHWRQEFRSLGASVTMAEALVGTKEPRKMCPKRRGREPGGNSRSHQGREPVDCASPMPQEAKPGARRVSPASDKVGGRPLWRLAQPRSGRLAVDWPQFFPHNRRTGLPRPSVSG